MNMHSAQNVLYVQLLAFFLKKTVWKIIMVFVTKNENLVMKIKFLFYLGK